MRDSNQSPQVVILARSCVKRPSVALQNRLQFRKKPLPRCPIIGPRSHSCKVRIKARWAGRRLAAIPDDRNTGHLERCRRGSRHILGLDVASTGRHEGNRPVWHARYREYGRRYRTRLSVNKVDESGVAATGRDAMDVTQCVVSQQDEFRNPIDFGHASMISNDA